MIDLQVQPGLYMQRSKRQALGRYTDGDNVRWYRGLPQKMGGFREELLVDSNQSRVWYKGHVRSAKQWDSLDSQNWVAFGTEYKLYLINNHQLYDITPIRRTATILNGFATTTGSLLITVTDQGHDSQAGDYVTYSGAAAIGNVNLNREWQVSAVIDLNTYVIKLDVPASTTNAGGGGAVLASYDINAGLTSDGTLTGYGTGPYGMEAYGTSRTGSTYGGTARIWSLDNWGEDLLAAPNGEALFWWQRSTGPDSHAIVRPNAPANIEHMLVGPDDRHVIALGTNLLDASATTVTGQQDKMFVRWCVGDNFDDWVQTTSNDAGSKRLDTGSRLITACKTRTSVVIFSDEGLYSTSLVGGTDVYAITPLGSSVKIISPGAAVDVLGVVHFMSQKGFNKFDGTLHDLECDVADYVFGSDKTPVLNRAMASKITSEYRQDFFEVRWNFPSLDSDENDRQVIFNTQLNCWYVSSVNRECGLDTNPFYGVPLGMDDTGVYMEETGFDVGTEEALFNFLETWEGELSASTRADIPKTATIWGQSAGEYLLLIHSMFPDFRELAGNLTLQMRGRDFTASDQVLGDNFTVDATTTQCDVQFCQRRVSVYMESVNMGDYWRMDLWRANGSPNGRRS